MENVNNTNWNPGEDLATCEFCSVKLLYSEMTYIKDSNDESHDCCEKCKSGIDTLENSLFGHLKIIK